MKWRSISLINSSLRVEKEANTGLLVQFLFSLPNVAVNLKMKGLYHLKKCTHVKLIHVINVYFI